MTRLRKIGFTSDYNTACSLETGIFQAIDATVDKIRQAERKKNGKK